jgi:hypothetical protein
MKSDGDFVNITLTFDRKEGDKAVLLSGQEEVVLPIKLLPKKVKEGDIISFSIATEEGARKRKEQKAKELLNEILRGE